MKNLAHFDYWQNSPIEALESMQHRLDVCFTLLDKLRNAGEMSSTELNWQTRLLMEEEGYSICPFFEHFWHDYIRTQIRAEEFIRVYMKQPIRGKITKTHEDNMIIFTPSYGYDPKPFLVFNPVITDEKHGEGCVQGNRVVQVRRKYYIWVG